MARHARLNLLGAAIPLISTQYGQSTLSRHEFDTNYIIANEYTGTQADRDIGIPTHLYMQNVIPVTHGVKSVGYVKQVEPLSSSADFFDKIFLLRSQDETKVFFSPARGRNFILGAATPDHWTGFPFPALQNGTVTHAYVNGKTYICYQQQGIYKYDPVLNNFIPVNLNGVVTTSVHGICNANNYLIIWDSNTVYWSSAIDELDFTPSLSTTSGSGKVQAARGAIVCCLPIHDGFIVYTTANAIAASFSGNARFPWNFREIPGSAGIVNPEHVTYDTNYDAHFAWTTSGMLQIDKQKAITIWPELTDFLTGREFEDEIGPTKSSDFAALWASETQSWRTDQTIDPYLTRVILKDTMRVKLAFLGARYIAISYGPQEFSDLTHALIYDIALRRWGKLRIRHTDLFTWVKPNYKYNNIEARKSFGVLTSDGAIYTVDFSDNAVALDTLYIFGRIKPLREATSMLLGVTIEGVSPHSNFKLQVLTSTAKQAYTKITDPALVISAGNMRKYNLRVSGNDHLLVMRGTFDLSNLEIEFNNSGMR